MPLTDIQRKYLWDKFEELARIGENLYFLVDEEKLESSFVGQYKDRISHIAKIIEENCSHSEGENKKELAEAKGYLNGAINTLNLAKQNITLKNDEEVRKNLQYASREIRRATNCLYRGAELSQDVGQLVPPMEKPKFKKAAMGVLVILAATFLLSSYSFPNLSGKTIAIESIPLDLVSFSIGIATLLILGYQITKK